MSTVFTLQEVMDRQGLGPDARAFCVNLLRQGEVLAVTLNYLPGTILWLVTTASQARIMRDTQPKAIILTLREATDLASGVGAERPASLWEVAVGLSAPAPPSPEDDRPERNRPDGYPPSGYPDDPDDPWADPWD